MGYTARCLGRCQRLQFKVRRVDDGGPGLAAVQTDFGEDVEEAANAIGGAQALHAGLDSGRQARTFTQHHPGAKGNVDQV